MKIGKKVKKVHILPKPIKIKLPVKKPVETPRKETVTKGE
jgi:hypothetical protein